jgi:hypothetical protein
MNDSPISNDSIQYEERIEFLKNQCQNKGNPSASTLHNLIRRNNILNYLGFVLRSHSLFYCSVPKVATRTLLTYITYLHIQDELISSFTNNSTPYYNNNSDLFNAEYLSKMLPNSKGVSESNMGWTVIIKRTYFKNHDLLLLEVFTYTSVRFFDDSPV